ncbi:MAG TPA: hypothetical protein ENK62_01830 [Chromatiales bacterium]|nr:hypothetical protein [Chromatiales bacterium]
MYNPTPLLRAAFFGLLLLLPLGASANAKQKAEALVDNARTTFVTVATHPDMTWLRANLHRAKGVMIFPQVLKGGFIVGGSGGSGVLVARDPKQGWSSPAFYTIGTASVGLQIGAQAAQVVMLVMTQKGIDALLTTKVNLGAGVSVAAGPVGVGAKAATADLVQYSLTKGAFGGVSLDGAVIKVREDYNAAYYGKPVSPVDILIKRTVRNPQATPLIRAIEKVEREASR